MSRAGMYSSRGDEYQVLVAVNLALDMLDGDDIQSLECEVLFDAQGREVPVDDIVVHHKNGDAVFCQCKVNSPGYGNWTFSSLKDDLIKAWEQFSRGSAGERFVFYSASPFPVLTGIIEAAGKAEYTSEFLRLMNAEAKRGFEDFRKMVDAQEDERLWRFFCMLSFRIVSLEVLQEEVASRLRRQVAGGMTALAVIKEEIRRMAARTDNAAKRRIHEEKFHLTRRRLLEVLETAGCRVTPLRREEELQRYFEAYSLRGTSWPRDIEGHRFPRRETEALQHLAEQGQNALLAGEAGAGKTCILLDLWDALKERSDLFSVFLQARDLGREELRKLTETFADAVARMAEGRKVVVVVDSLDVLSMAGEEFFGPVRAVLDQLRPMKNVTVVAACRSFDFRYDPHFAMFRPWERVDAGPLDVEKEVLPWLHDRGVDVARLSEKQKKLISLPRMLGMFLFVWQECGGSDAVTPWELVEEYLHQLGRRRTDWPELREHLEDIALRMLEKNRLAVGRDELELNDEHLRFCLSEGVLWEEKFHRYTFIHQTWTDWLVVSHAIRNGTTLSEFITAMPSRPSLRAAVRVFFFALRERDSTRFRREVREALRSKKTAFHFKWLLAASMAGVEPEEGDVSLLFNKLDRYLFSAFLDAAEQKRWFAFLWNHLVPEWKEAHDRWSLVRFGIWSGHGEGVDQAGIVRLWTYLLETGREDDVVVEVLFWLNDVSGWDIPGLRKLFERLMDVMGETLRLMLGKSLSRWVESVNGNDDLLWRFITHKVKPVRMAISIRLACGVADFYRRDFLEGRLRDSEALLDMALASMDAWSRRGDMTLKDGTRYFFHDCIRKKAPGAVYSIDMLFSAVVQACISHAGKNSPWWREHAAKLWASEELGIRYLCLCGLLAQPQNNLSLVQEALSHIGKAPCGVFFEQSLALLLQKAAPHLEKAVLDALQRDLIALGREAPDAGQAARFWNMYLAAVPAPYRLPESVAVLEKLKIPAPSAAEDGETMRFGPVVSPCDEDRLLELSDEALLRLLRYYSAPGTGDRLGEYENGHFLGGAEELARALSSAARRKPEAFWLRMKAWPEDIAPLFADAVMEGVAHHAWSRFGNLIISGAKPALTEPSREWLRDALTDMGTMAGKGKVQARTATALLTACGWMVCSLAEAERLRDMAAWTDRLSAGQGSDDTQEFENTVRGSWVLAVCTLAARLGEKHIPLPPWLNDRLFAFAASSCPGPRAVLLRQLSAMRLSAEESWTLFDRAVAPGPAEIWNFALEYLCDSVGVDYEKTMSYVDAMGSAPLKDSADMLGEVLTWAFLLQRMSRQEYMRRLSTLDHAGVWLECMRMLVFRACNDETLREPCFEGIRGILACRRDDGNIISESIRLFYRNVWGFVFVPSDIVETILTQAGNVPELFTSFYCLPEWCLYCSRRHCREALAVMEKLWAMPRICWGREKGDILCDILKRFFQEAEESGPEEGIRERVEGLVETILKKDAGAMQAWLEESVRR